MSWKKPRITLTGPEGDNEEVKTSVIRPTNQQMVSEIRASVRERVSNIRPEGLPPPGKTTQGFRGSRSSSGESVKPKSFRTIRNFWRHREGEDVVVAPPRRLVPLRKISQAAEKPKTSGWKMPILRRTPNARESARRESQRKRSSSTRSKRSSASLNEDENTPMLKEKSKRAPSFEEDEKSPTGKDNSKRFSSIEEYTKTSESEPYGRSTILRGEEKTSMGNAKSKRISSIEEDRKPVERESSRRSTSLLGEEKISVTRQSLRRSSTRLDDDEKRPKGNEKSRRSTNIEEDTKTPMGKEKSKRFTSFAEDEQTLEREPSRRSTSLLGEERISLTRQPLRISSTSLYEDEKTPTGKTNSRISASFEESEKTSMGKEKSRRSTGFEEDKKLSEREPSRRTIPANERKSERRETFRRSSISLDDDEVTPTGNEKSRRSTSFEESEKTSMGKEKSRRSTGFEEDKKLSEREPSRRIIPVNERKSERRETFRRSSINLDDDEVIPTGNEKSRRSASFEEDTKILMEPALESQEPKKSMIRSSIRSSVKSASFQDAERTSGASEYKGSNDSMRKSRVSIRDPPHEEEDMEERAEEGDEMYDEDRDRDGEKLNEDGQEYEIEEEEDMEEEKFPVGKVSDAAVSPPTAGLRPSSLWAQLPRMFSDESVNRPSVILPVLLEEEKLFHELVAGGIVEAVDDFLSRRPNFNINCENYQGTSALHIAVKNDDEDMVQYLLSLPGIEVRDSHLYAIRNNHPGILVMILDKLQSINPALEVMACSNSPEFAENITPLILAAEAGHFEIVGLLLGRGHLIPRPHKPRCFCKEECQAIMKSQDPLSISSGKLHIYRAFSNPVYVCQTDSDPLLLAFKLSKELLTCGHVDTIYRRQYEVLAESLRAFAVDLIAECRTLEEVETILSEPKNCNLKGHWTYPRLVIAMDFKQKEFIAHPNVQQVLERTWIGDWIAWRGYRVYTKLSFIILRLFTLPMVLGVLMVTPTSKWAKHFSLPVNKLLSNVASYFIFLVLVFIQSNVDKKNQTRDTKPTGVEIFLVIYVLTFIYNTVRSILKQGYRYFKFTWNIYEIVMELFFVMAFVFLIAAEIKTTIKGDKDLERKYWYYLDPELISESFFVLAAVMAFMKILLLFQISYHLGPLQVSLGKMTNDCAMFSVIFAIIIIAFTAGLCRFYSYYEDMVQMNPDTGEVESTQVNSFTGVIDTFKTLFWGLFGMSSFDVADVVIDNTAEDTTSATTPNEHHLTEAVGYFAFACYMILTVIVILNMLIATMSNTFQKVNDNVDTEWLFGRTEVYMSYIDLPVLPPPFNVIPTTHALVNFIKGQQATKGSKLIGVDAEKGTVEEENKRHDDYFVLMSQLVQRYFSTKNSENE